MKKTIRTMLDGNNGNPKPKSQPEPKPIIKAPASLLRKVDIAYKLILTVDGVEREVGGPVVRIEDLTLILCDSARSLTAFFESYIQEAQRPRRRASPEDECRPTTI